MDDMIERALAFVQRKYVARESRGILYIEAAQDDLAREIVNFCRAALTPADLATLAEGMGLAVVPTNPDANILNALYGRYLSESAHRSRIRAYHTMLTAARIKPGQEGGEDE